MPSQTQQSVMPEDPGFDAILQKGAKDKTTVAQRGLPGGINKGIARLIEVRLGTYAKGPTIGKPFLYLAGNVLDPELHTDGTKIRGRRTSQTMPLCATAGKKEAENANEVLAMMRSLGGINCTENVKKRGDLLALGKALVAKGIIFTFDTSESPGQTKPDPKKPGQTITYSSRVWENWRGTEAVPHDYQPPKAQGMTPAASSNGSAATQEAPEETNEPEEETTTEEGSGDDSGTPEELPGDHEIDELVTQADDNDVEARNKLISLAIQIGNTREEAESDEVTWSDIGDWIRSARNEEAAPEEEAAAEPEVKTWKAKDMCKVKFLVKNKAGALVKGKNYTDCKIISVDKAKETCVVMDLATKKEHKGIKLDALEEN